jgi:MobA/MobL family
LSLLLSMPHYALRNSTTLHFTMHGALRGWLTNFNYFTMASGFVSVSHSGSGRVDYYLREGECLEFKHSNGLLDLSEIKNHWQEIEKNEKIGNKDLNIRGRHDARVRTNYILSMPNELQAKDCIDRTEHLIKQTPIKDCTYTIVVHKGEKDGITNQHVHLLVNERNLTTMKKDREMQRKEWLEKEFRPMFAKEFSAERSQGKTYEKRERIETALYQADTQLARQAIASQNVTISQGLSKSMEDRMREEQKFLEMQKLYEQGKLKHEQDKIQEQKQQREIQPSFSKGRGMSR